MKMSLAYNIRDSKNIISNNGILTEQILDKILDKERLNFESIIQIKYKVYPLFTRYLLLYNVYNYKVYTLYFIKPSPNFAPFGHTSI